MNKKLTIELLSFCSIAVMLLLAACVKDNIEQQHKYTYYQPVYKTKAEVRNNIRSNAIRTVEHPGKINIRGNYIFLNEVDRGIHVINNTNPSQPQHVAFIDIPGNMDMAVKGNILYADLYTDLVAIDITDPLNAKLMKTVEGVFPHRYWGGGFRGQMGSDLIIVEWQQRDTVITTKGDQPQWWWGRADIFMLANSSSGASTTKSSSPIGAGGSMARFTIMNDRLYTVGYSDLDVFNITEAKNPTHTSKVNVGWNIETIYPFKNKLFIGSTSGMFIYNVSNPDAPAAAGKFEHVSSCDPVVADDKYAYVTLRSGTECQGFTNQLEIVQLNNITDPKLLTIYPMENPHGLSKDDNLLFICDGAAGLKIYDAADVMNLKKINEIRDIDTYDIITMNNVALVVAKDGLYQYNYANPANITMLSKITIAK
jgi:hypothetical protein